MATLNVKLTQNVIDTNKKLEQDSLSYAVSALSYYDLPGMDEPDDTYYDDSLLSATWNDGSYLKMTGSGFSSDYSATVDDMNLYIPSLISMSMTGPFSVTQGSYGTTNSGNFNVKINILDASIVPSLGKMSATLKGSFDSDDYSNATKISELSMSADKFMKSATLTGNLSTNTDYYGNSSMSGYITKYSESYYDGSYVDLSGSINISSSESYQYQSLMANSDFFSGNDTFNIDLPGTLSESHTLNAGKGNDNITVKGGGGKLSVNAGEGNDSVILLNNAPKLILGAGQDTLAIKSISGKALISDFNAKDDTIQLENAIFIKLTKVGNLSSANFIANATGKAKDKDDYVVYNSKTGALSYDADGSGSVKAIEIALVGNKASLTVSDFVVI